jgi:Putative Flp pilus-assembly TadE/G-like
MRAETTEPHGNGQILVVFALSLITLLGFAGLAIDGGSAFAQRRDEQTASDLAALAGANDYLINGDLSLAITRARSVASSNGFTHARDGVIVAVDINTDNGIALSVSISAPHHNSMAAVLGMPIWTVSTTATALSGFPDTAHGASPFIFSVGAFGTDGTPKYTTPTTFGEGNGDIPISDKDLAWTNYGTGNVDTSQVTDIITGDLQIDKTLSFGEYIGQHNNGNHSFLYDYVDSYLDGLEVPAAIVDSSGNFVGWATFHVISADQGTKKLRGYFVTDFESARMTISSCAANDCPRYLGSYILKLTN